MSPRYVYGCNCGNREEVIHPVETTIIVACGSCGEWMARVPQSFSWYINPVDVLYDKMDAGYRNYRSKKAREKRSR